MASTPLRGSLPAAVLARQGIDLAAVMRESHFTLAHQALLARRMLLPERELKTRTRTALLACDLPPRLMAWRGARWARGATSALVLGRIYETCIGGDTDWAVRDPTGLPGGRTARRRPSSFDVGIQLAVQWLKQRIQLALQKSRVMLVQGHRRLTEPYAPCARIREGVELWNEQSEFDAIAQRRNAPDVERAA